MPQSVADDFQDNVMARKINKLTPREVASKTTPGLYNDGAGLYLQVGPTGGKSWLLRYMIANKAKNMGLGAVHTISLAEAREQAQAARKLLLQGIDPVEEKRKRLGALRSADAKTLTFDECAAKYIASHRTGWKNPKHAEQWVSTLAAYASPHFGNLPVNAVDTGLVLAALEAIWQGKSETATRVRGRIESVLNWATVRGYRKGENPARWKGHLDTLLPARSKVAKVQHHAALPYSEMGAFFAELKQQPGTGALALVFTILTAARTGEVIGAQWNEIDLTNARWTIPAGRMKAEREHVIPLSGYALKLLKNLPCEDGNPFVFIGTRQGRGLSNMAMLEVLRRMERSDLTVHGFRSTFRDWAGETTAYPREVIEHALAHQIKDKAEAAYQRGTLLDKRAKLMQAWADYCDKKPGKTVVTPIRGVAHAK